MLRWSGRRHPTHRFRNMRLSVPGGGGPNEATHACLPVKARAQNLTRLQGVCRGFRGLGIAYRRLPILQEPDGSGSAQYQSKTRRAKASG